MNPRRADMSFAKNTVTEEKVNHPLLPWVNLGMADCHKSLDDTTSSSGDISSLNSKELAEIAQFAAASEIEPTSHKQYEVKGRSAFNRFTPQKVGRVQEVSGCLMETEACQKNESMLPVISNVSKSQHETIPAQKCATTNNEVSENGAHNTVVVCYVPVYFAHSSPQESTIPTGSAYSQPSITIKQEHKIDNSTRGRRSRSRSRGRGRNSRSPEHLNQADRKRSAEERRDRPQKFMMKVLFTPLKRILKSYKLKEMGVNMDDYFRVRGEPRGGHRTPADIELVMWYVETKYRTFPGTYEKFVEYLLAHRRDLEHYGQEAYGEGYPKEWLIQYSKLLKTILSAVQTPSIGRARFLSLYTRRPSEQSFHNLRELKEEFYTQGVFPRAESAAE